MRKKKHCETKKINRQLRPVPNAESKRNVAGGCAEMPKNDHQIGKGSFQERKGEKRQLKGNSNGKK